VKLSGTFRTTRDGVRAAELQSAARQLNSAERIEAARNIAAWAERKADSAGEQGHQLLEMRPFTIHRLATARRSRNQEWMAELFG
jgi:hypothetical protein